MRRDGFLASRPALRTGALACEVERAGSSGWPIAASLTWGDQPCPSTTAPNDSADDRAGPRRAAGFRHHRRGQPQTRQQFIGAIRLDSGR